MTEKVDLSYELAQIKQLVRDHDIAVSEMRGNDAEGIRFQIADACQDFVLGSLVSLESALADQRRLRDGYVIVPCEVTEPMRDAYIRMFTSKDRFSVEKMWGGMVRAAIDPEGGHVEG